MSRSIIWIVALVFWLGAAAGSLVGCTGDAAPRDSSISLDRSSAKYKGVQIQPVRVKPAMTLTDQDGRPFDFAARTQGYLTLVYLGYTHCPDVCPAHMSKLGQVMKLLPDSVAKRITVVFVTTDPARDTPEVLRSWLGSFDGGFIGLTGDDASIARISRGLGMNPPERQDLGNGAYAVSHAAYVLAFTADGKAHLVYPLETTVDEWQFDLTKLVEEGWK